MSATAAIVTGAGAGIGQAAAARLALDQLHVVCADIDGTAAERTASQVRGAGGLATSCQADVRCAADCQRVADLASAQGHLRVLCNVAGISPFGTGIAHVSEEVWDRVLAVNVKSVFLMSRACLPQLSVPDRHGVIINMASVHAYAALPESAPYAASKGAVVALTRQMAVDLAGAGIRVVGVAPGAVDTPSSHAGAAALGRNLTDLFSADRRRLGWLAEPADIAEVIAWLASDHARFVNGTTLVADGGLLAGMQGSG